ncbi:MAG: GumC family protein [Syntrophobacteraceae bacterium]
MKTQATVRILLHSLFLRKNLIILMNLVILATILIGSLLWPSVYQAESSLMLLGRNYPDLLTPGPRSMNFSVAMMNTRDEINSEIEVIRSRPVLEKTVKTLRLDQEKQPEFLATFKTLKELVFPKSNGAADNFEAAVNNLKKNLKTDPAVESQIMLVRYRSHDPALASQIVNTIVDEYLKQHLAIYINHAESAFYAEQIKNLQANLKILQDQLVGVKTASGIVSFSDQARALLAKLQSFDTALANVQKEMITSSSKLQRIQELRKTKPDLLIPLPEYAQDA